MKSEEPLVELRSCVSAATLIMILGLMGLFGPSLKAQSNPGDPLFCDPNEGVTFLIVNGGTGVFTANSDCFGNNLAANNTNPAVINTSQGGTLTRNGPSSSGNYIYSPPTPNFTGLDTFPFTVTTDCDRNGFPAGISTTCPGGPFAYTVTLNVLPSTMMFTSSGTTPILIPIPAGSVSGCTNPPAGNSGTGPTATDVLGCTTAVIRGFGGVSPSNGTLTASGNALLYTPGGSFTGTDTFTVQVQGINTDGTRALNSGNVTVTIAPPPTVPALQTWGMALLAGLLLFFGYQAASRRTA